MSDIVTSSYVAAETGYTPRQVGRIVRAEKPGEGLRKFVVGGRAAKGHHLKFLNTVAFQKRLKGYSKQERHKHTSADAAFRRLRKQWKANHRGKREKPLPLAFKYPSLSERWRRFVEKHPLSDLPAPTLEKVRADLEPTARVLWPEMWR